MEQLELCDIKGRVIGLETLVTHLWHTEVERRGWSKIAISAAFEAMASSLEVAPASGADEETLTLVRFQAAETIRRVGDLVEHHRTEPSPEE